MYAKKLKPANVLMLLAVIGQLSSVRLSAQTATTPKTRANESVIVQRQATAPQVVTVLHRLNRLKLLRLLIQSGEQIGAVDNLDQAFDMSTQVHTNIIAGLALDDGQTIAAWLPEAEVEIEASMLPGTMTQSSEDRATTMTWTFSPEAPDLTVIERDGRRRPARYIGLDGITGLSVLRLAEKGASPPAVSASTGPVAAHQRIHLFSPEPVQAGADRGNAVRVRVGESEGQVTSVTQRSFGGINRIRIRSAKLSAANIGGVALNDSGQTIGIVIAIDSRDEATLLPLEAIRGAAQRVLARQGSVPRPWLGVSGEPIASIPVEQIVGKGWLPAQASMLMQKKEGILLTSIAPTSPAALALLQPGDVIVSVNDNDVRTIDDFSGLLADSGVDNPVRFTIARPGREVPETVTVRLKEPSGSRYSFKTVEVNEARTLLANPLVNSGVEAVPLRPAAATPLGASKGLLVVFVQPESPAFKSGLLSGDVIESINAQQLTVESSENNQPATAATYTLNVVRNKQKLVLVINTTTP